VSDVIVSALIAAMGGILTATITAFFQYLIAREKPSPGADKKNEPKGKGPRKGGPGHKGPVSTTPSQPRSKIDWRVTMVITGVATLLVFVGAIIRVSARTAPPSTPVGSLATANVEFRISSKLQIIVPAGGTLDTLHPGDQVSIEAIVKDANKNPYPNPITITYYFSSGEALAASVAPYLAKKSDTITVKIEDQVTGEVITRIMRVNIWIEPT
jgi:hypothetical protein